MNFKSYWLIILLALSQILASGYGEYRGTFFGRANFDFSVPFVFVSKYDTLKDEKTFLGDYYYEQFSVPFFISLEIAYLAAFTDKHRLIGLWKIKYNDDYINFSFNDDIKTKINASKFNSQNLNNFLLIKYIWDVNSFFQLSPSFHVNFDLNRTSRFENFLNNFYNSHIYGLFFNFKFKNLGESTSELKKMIFDFDIGYSYNYFPNSKIIIFLKDLPDTKEDYHSVDFTFKYWYKFYPNFYFNTSYRFNFRNYAQKLVHSGDIDKGYSDSNQKDIVNNLDLSISMNLVDRGSYQIVNLTTAYTFRYFYSSHVEFMKINRTKVGDYPIPSSALLAIDSFTFYQPDFKNHLSNLVGLYAKFNINDRHGFQLGYAFTIKNYFRNYGRLGSSLNKASNDDSSTVESSTTVNSKATQSFGTYSDEKKKDIFHTVSFGYVWKSSSKDRLFYPFIGMQVSHSNDRTLKLNRYIFVFGLKIKYEF